MVLQPHRTPSVAAHYYLFPPLSYRCFWVDSQVDCQNHQRSLHQPNSRLAWHLLLLNEQLPTVYATPQVLSTDPHRLYLSGYIYLVIPCSSSKRLLIKIGAADNRTRAHGSLQYHWTRAQGSLQYHCTNLGTKNLKRTFYTIIATSHTFLCVAQRTMVTSAERKREEPKSRMQKGVWSLWQIKITERNVINFDVSKTWGARQEKMQQFINNKWERKGIGKRNMN